MKEITQRDNKGRFTIGHQLTRGKLNPNWKDSGFGYTALHDWLYLRLGNPSLCSKCGTTTAKKYEWANISGEYRRDVSDWMRLCTSCHRFNDGHGFKMWQTRRQYA